MRHCTFCHTELPDRAQFCGYCGHLTNVTGERTLSASSRSVQDGSTFISDDALPTSIGEHEDVRGNTPDPLYNKAVWTPPASQQVREEEEQDRRRRALIWGVPLAAAGTQGPAGAPTVQGTPQLSNAPVMPGTPRVQYPYQTQSSSGAPTVQGTPQLSNVPVMPGTPRVQYPYQAPPQSSAGAPTVPGTPQLSNAPIMPGTPRVQYPYQAPPERKQKRKSSSRGAIAAKGAALKWLIVVFTAALVLATAGVGATFAFSPTLSSSGLSGNSIVVQGQHLHLHGKGFLPGGHITLKRDNGKTVQLAAQNTPAPGNNASLLMSLTTLSLATPTNAPLAVSSSGAFDATLLIGRDWLRGNHTILATEDVFARSATMTVNVGEAPPVLAVTPNSLNFGSVQAGTKTAVTLAIGNTGGQPLTWTAATDGTAWLSLQSTSGGVLPYGIPQSLVVMCDATSLSVGTYTAIIHMNSNGGTANLKVSLRVVAQAQAKLSISPSVLDFQTMDTNQQATQAITISNTGTVKMNWQASSNQDWATLDTTNDSILPGDVAQNINVHVDTTGMKAGSYAATISITSNGGNAQIPIALLIAAPATPTPPTATPLPPTAVPTLAPTATPTSVPQGIICKLPSTLDFGLVPLGQTTTKTLTLGNCGNASFTWKPLPDSSWITVNNPGGTLVPNTAATVNVTVDTTSLTASPGQGKVTFFTSVGNQAVTVTVKVQQPLLTPTASPTPTPVSIE